MKTCPTCTATYGDEVRFCPRDGFQFRGSAFQPGDVIRKKYEILSELGRGGMGVVYRARHLVWKEEKALKVLVAMGAAEHQSAQSLLAEAMVMRQFQHPHIVRVEDVDYTEEDQPFVVMEYVDGESLKQRLASAGPLPPEQALTIAAQACSALSAAHRRGIVHRDIKPANILLAKSADGREQVKVIDFGIAKVRDEVGLGFTGMLTGTTGLFVGTYDYASPEQAQGMRGSDLDGRSDVYSLGLVLYQMLTGGLPFGAETPLAILNKRLLALPPPPDRVRPDLHIPADVSRLVMKALETDRENRYASAEQMERAIVSALDSRRLERERAEAARLAEERRRREEAEAARLAAELAERERQDREKAEAAKAAADAEAAKAAADAEVARLTAELERARAEKDRLARHETERKKPEQPARPPVSGDYGGPTVVVGRKRLLSVAAGLGLALLAVGLFFLSRRADPPDAQTQTDVTHPIHQPAGSKRANPKDGLTYVWIPPGTFQMGCSPGDNECYDDEKPPKPATIHKGFWLGESEVTQAAYQRVIGKTPSHFKGEDLPVEEVNRDEVQTYCQAVGGRLPTEAEWEYAARAETTGARYGELDRIAWYSKNSDSKTHPVKQKEPNKWGLYDMLGNVWEWVDGEYPLRGGSWVNGPRNARASNRVRLGPSLRYDLNGFRCAWE